VIFKKAFSQGPGTMISMPSLFTGKYPSRLPSFKILSPFALRQHVRGVTVGEAPTLTEILRDHGYRTAGFHSNPFLTSYFGFHRGFDVFYDDMTRGSKVPQFVSRWLWRLSRLYRASPHLSAAAVNKKTLKWLRGVDGRFFLWLHYMDTHGPYQSKRGLRYLNKIKGEVLFRKAAKRPESVTPDECRVLRDWYTEEVTYLDRHLGRLFDAIGSMGRMDETLVIVTADHGEEFGEHGRFGHPWALYDELLHVPLVVKLPGAAHRGRVVRSAVGLIQVLPTILEVAGIRAMERMDGKSLVSLAEHDDRTRALEFVVSEAGVKPRYKACVRIDDWKLIVDEGANRRELYDLGKDPGELTNVIDANPEARRRLETALARHQATGGFEDADADARVDGAVLARLEELGYL